MSAHAQRGSAAAELAITMPVLLLVLALCIGGVQAASAHVRLQDAAADAARGIARGDSPQLVAARAEHALARTQIQQEQELAGDLVCVTLRAPAHIAGINTGIELTARSCALSGGR